MHLEFGCCSSCSFAGRGIAVSYTKNNMFLFWLEGEKKNKMVCGLSLQYPCKKKCLAVHFGQTCATVKCVNDLHTQVGMGNFVWKSEEMCSDGFILQNGIKKRSCTGTLFGENSASSHGV